MIASQRHFRVPETSTTVAVTAEPFASQVWAAFCAASNARFHWTKGIAATYGFESSRADSFANETKAGSASSENRRSNLDTGPRASLPHNLDRRCIRRCRSLHRLPQAEGPYRNIRNLALVRAWKTSHRFDGMSADPEVSLAPLQARPNIRHDSG
jgi:hypothetical protein